MDYSTFKKEVPELISQKLGAEYKVRLFELRKSNGIVQDNLSIQKKDTSISPCIDLRYYFQKYIQGTVIEDIANAIIAYYIRSMPEQLEPDNLLDPGYVRNQIVCSLVNTDRSQEFLKECPHFPFLNLSVVFYLLIDDVRIGTGTVMIRNVHMQQLKLKKEELLGLAMKNMGRLLPADFMTTEQLISELRGGCPETENGTAECSNGYADSKVIDNRHPLFVLTNSRRSYGAVWMMDAEVLRRVADQLKDDFYVIPSSIHECMVLPAGYHLKTESISRIVRRINRTKVAPEEVLADSVYRYDRAKGRLIIAA